jgi:hypothetical protein
MSAPTHAGSAGVVGDWRHRAACRDVDPELFYPAADSGPPIEAQVAEAKTVCAGCPVRAECLTFAMSALPHGVAGGLTPAERRRYRGRSPHRVSTAAGRPVGGSRPEIAAAGRAAIRAGRPVREVAREFGVTARTAERWAAQVRAKTNTETSTTTSGPAGLAQGRGVA